MPFILDGIPVPRKYWRYVKPKLGTTIVVRASVHGGGGGGGKNNRNCHDDCGGCGWRQWLLPLLVFAAGTMAATLVTAGVRLCGRLIDWCHFFTLHSFFNQGTITRK